jgi:hypothetical protein
VNGKPSTPGAGSFPVSGWGRPLPYTPRLSRRRDTWRSAPKTDSASIGFLALAADCRAPAPFLRFGVHCADLSRGTSWQALEGPPFPENVRNIVSLYMDPPARTLLLCADEKSQIQALDRTQPLWPMRLGPSGAPPPRLRPSRHHVAVFCAGRANEHAHRPRSSPPPPWSSASFSTDPPSRTLQHAGARGGHHRLHRRDQRATASVSPDQHRRRDSRQPRTILSTDPRLTRLAGCLNLGAPAIGVERSLFLILS